MPIYEYACIKCGDVVEELRNLDEKSTEWSVEPCIQCLARRKKIISATPGKVKDTINPVKMGKSKG